MTKPKRGGPNRNQGRKPVKPGEDTITVSMRMTQAQRDKLARLGGAAWVRGRIDGAREAVVLDDGTSLKHCPKCGNDKPRTEFSRDIARPDGLRTWCRVCNRASSMKWQKENVRTRKKKVPHIDTKEDLIAKYGPEVAAAIDDLED